MSTELSKNKFARNELCVALHFLQVVDRVAIFTYLSMKRRVIVIHSE